MRRHACRQRLVNTMHRTTQVLQLLLAGPATPKRPDLKLQSKASSWATLVAIGFSELQPVASLTTEWSWRWLGSQCSAQIIRDTQGRADPLAEMPCRASWQRRSLAALFYTRKDTQVALGRRAMKATSRKGVIRRATQSPTRLPASPKRLFRLLAQLENRTAALATIQMIEDVSPGGGGLDGLLYNLSGFMVGVTCI